MATATNKKLVQWDPSEVKAELLKKYPPKVARKRAKQILINKRVYAEVGELVQVEPVGELVLKGLHSPVTVYNVLGLK